jgi:hypothetical protein
MRPANSQRYRREVTPDRSTRDRRAFALRTHSSADAGHPRIGRQRLLAPQGYRIFAFCAYGDYRSAAFGCIFDWINLEGKTAICRPNGYLPAEV